MKKFRKIWLIFVVFVIVIWAAYCSMQYRKADSSGPVISGGEDQIKVSIRDEEAVLLQGITASDKKDGDVTDSLLVESISKFYDDGTRIVTYAAFDSDHHISKMQRKISYTDYTAPRFSLGGSLRFRAGEQLDIDKIVSVTDCLDGDLSGKVKIHTDTTINNRVIGFYTIEYEVSNSAGDTVILPIDIEIYEPYNNEVGLNLDRYLVYYTGETIDYKRFLKSVNKGSMEYPFEGVTLIKTEIPAEEEVSAVVSEEENTEEDTLGVIPKSRVRVDAQVNTSTPGVYPVYYYYTEDHGTYKAEAKEVLYVVVE